MNDKGSAWVHTMVETLVCEILTEMANLRIWRAEEPIEALKRRKMIGVCATIGGDYTFKMRFFAEKPFFYRLAKNMMGEEPDEEDIRDYAMEFINVVCGRFISEIINETHIKARLMPVEYRMPTNGELQEEEESMQTMGFVGDGQEYAAFSWTTMAIEDMVRRSKLNG